MKILIALTDIQGLCQITFHIWKGGEGNQLVVLWESLNFSCFYGGGGGDERRGVGSTVLEQCSAIKTIQNVKCEFFMLAYAKYSKLA